jgi:hypothetical protein
MLLTESRHAVRRALLAGLARLKTRSGLHSARLISAADLAVSLMAARLAIAAVREAILLRWRNGKLGRHPILGQAILLRGRAWQQPMRP